MAISHDAVREKLAGRVVLDGATGTELARRGVPTPLPLWSAGALLTHPDVVRAIHEEYVAAGAEIVVANTFRTNARKLRRAGMFEQGEILNRTAVALARVAANGGKVIVAASVAPVEDCYYPERVPDDDALLDEHRQMAAWLASAAPDLAWIETINTVREGRAACRAMREAGMAAAVSFVTAERGTLLSGEPLEAAVEAVEEFEPMAIGLNCIPPEGVTRLLPRLREMTKRPVAVYAHLGNPEPITGWSFSSEVSPVEYGKYARQWWSQGANIVGGCCGTTPEHVRAVKAARAEGDGRRDG